MSAAKTTVVKTTFLQKLGNFFKDFGNVAVSASAVAGKVLPLIAPLLPAADQAVVAAASNDLSAVANVVISAEQMFVNIPGASGSQKLAAAAPFVAQIVSQMEIITGKTPADPVKFEAACTALTSAMADILNSFGD